MDPNIAALIQIRAGQIGRIAAHLLVEENSQDLEVSAAYRWAYLLLRKPAVFLREFGVGFPDLTICEADVEYFISRYGDRISGLGRLLPAEIEILRFHNAEAERIMVDRGHHTIHRSQHQLTYGHDDH
jgi:hypothetical protein